MIITTPSFIHAILKTDPFRSPIASEGRSKLLMELTLSNNGNQVLWDEATEVIDVLMLDAIAHVPATSQALS